MTANRVLIGLALSNLVTNAFRHTPAGTTVGVAVDPDGSIAVTDDGPGITAHTPDQLTRRFWRADHARSDSAGLGLAIVDRVARVHGTVLTIGNRPGGGAVFSIRLGGH